MATEMPVNYQLARAVGRMHRLAIARTHDTVSDARLEEYQESMITHINKMCSVIGKEKKDQIKDICSLPADALASGMFDLLSSIKGVNAKATFEAASVPVPTTTEA